MNEWNIQSRAHACQACGNGFLDKQTYHTLLLDEKNQLTRLDVCEGCWATQFKFSQGAADRKGFVSYWHGQYEAPPAAPPDPIKRETAEGLLRKLIERNDPAHAAACFILAVMLERKRLLKVKQQFVRDGRRIFLYEHPKSGDLFTIPDPDLQLNQLEAVQQDVADLMEHGLPDSTPPQAEATAQAPAAESIAAAPDSSSAASAPPASGDSATTDSDAATDAPASSDNQPAAPAQDSSPAETAPPAPENTPAAADPQPEPAAPEAPTTENSDPPRD